VNKGNLAFHFGLKFTLNTWSMGRLKTFLVTNITINCNVKHVSLVVIDQARFECAPRAGFTKNSRRMCYAHRTQINSGLVHLELNGPFFLAVFGHVRQMEKKQILFVCTHNSARSQLAEGLIP
jgi:hypothetical protein